MRSYGGTQKGKEEKEGMQRREEDEGREKEEWKGCRGKVKEEKEREGGGKSTVSIL